MANISDLQPSDYGAASGGNVSSLSTNDFLGGLGSSSGSTQSQADQATNDDQETFGSTAPTTLPNTLLNNTIGYSGIGGLVGRPIVSAMTAGATAPVANAKTQLAQVNEKLIQKFNTMSPSDPNYATIQDTIAGNQKAMSIANDTLNNLGNAQETQEQNAANALNSAATLAVGASPLIPAAATGALKVAGRIGIGAAYGGAVGAANQMEQNASASKVGMGVAVGAGTGATLAGAGELGGAIVDNFAGNTPTSRLQAQTGRLKTLQNAFNEAKTNPIQTITDLGTPLRVVDGHVDTSVLQNTLDTLQEQINTKAQSIVADMPGTVSTADFQTAVENAIKANPSIRGAGGVASALAKVDAMFKDYTTSYGTEIPYTAVNEIRTSMNRFFDPETVDVQRTVANVARDYLYNADNGSPELKTLMQQWGKYEDAQNFTQKLSNTAVRGGRLGKYLADMTGAGVGGMVGSTMGPLGTFLGAGAGGMAADKVSNVLQNSYFNPLLTGPAQGLSTAMNSAPAQGLFNLGTQAAARGASSMIPSTLQ
jgi:hypothetical protein